MNIKDFSTDDLSARLGRVAVLYGGMSAERQVSLKSGSMVLAALKRGGLTAQAFDPAEQPLEELKKQGVERVFIALHGRYGEDGTVQGALELLGIPYTGSGVLASALAMDKWRTKLIWQALGIKTPRSELLTADTNFSNTIKELGLPLIVKPSREGSTIGLTKVTDLSQMAKAYADAAQHDDAVLAEQFIAGQELTAAVLGGQTLPLVRIEAASGLYDYHAKYLANDTQYHCPAGLSAEAESAIQAESLRAYEAVDCRGWGRVDVILDERGEAWFLEVNTSPGMTDHSLVPMAARTAGIEYDELVLRILAQTLDIKPFIYQGVNHGN
jgi:D-alanine-D-alanine ligase